MHNDSLTNSFDVKFTPTFTISMTEGFYGKRKRNRLNICETFQGYSQCVVISTKTSLSLCSFINNGSFKEKIQTTTSYQKTICLGGRRGVVSPKALGEGGRVGGVGRLVDLVCVHSVPHILPSFYLGFNETLVARIA